MATRFIERASSFPGDSAEGGDTKVPIYVDSDTERLTYYDRTLSKFRTVENGLDYIITPTAAVTLTVEQSGANVMLNAAAGFAITLPAPTAGVRYRFTTAAAFATTAFTIVTNGGANIFQGSIIVAGAVVDVDGGDTITFSASLENVGDFIDVWSDGTSWFTCGNALTASAITISAT